MSAGQPSTAELDDAHTHQRVGLGITLVVCATLCFALLDTVSQPVSPLVPVVMAIWIRYVAQTVLTTALLWPQQGKALLMTRAPGWQLLRGALMVCSSVVAFVSLRHVPVGNFTAIMMLVPLAVTILAARLLGERVRPLAWWLVAGGLSGALIVIRPKAGDLHGAMLLPLLLVLINAVYQIVTSHMVRSENPGTMHFYTGLLGLLCCSLLLPWAWEPLTDWTLWALAALLGVFGSLGHYLLIQAFHRAPASRLTPYMYAQIGFATLGGWIAFNQAPDAWTLTGIALIALCGWLGVRLR
jgi:drug/metabolite transporter (DMT)-like permease